MRTGISTCIAVFFLSYFSACSSVPASDLQMSLGTKRTTIEVAALSDASLRKFKAGVILPFKEWTSVLYHPEERILAFSIDIKSIEPISIKFDKLLIMQGTREVPVEILYKDNLLYYWDGLGLLASDLELQRVIERYAVPDATLTRVRKTKLILCVKIDKDQLPVTNWECTILIDGIPIDYYGEY